MIKPASYWALHKEADAVTLGRVGLALAGREGELSPPLAHAEKLIVAMIRHDSNWMDENIAAKKQKVAEAVKRHREKKKAESATENVNDVMITPITPPCNITPDCNIPSLLPTSILPSSILSKDSESVEAHTHTRTRGDVPDLKTVITTATTVMGIPEAYARWWYTEMTARDWTNSQGGMIGNRNWRSVLKSWHNKATPEELAKIKQEADAAAKSAPKITAQDWTLCAERCANYRMGFKCAAGCSLPPSKAANPHPPEECPRYKADNTAENGAVGAR